MISLRASLLAFLSIFFLSSCRSQLERNRGEVLFLSFLDYSPESSSFLTVLPFMMHLLTHPANSKGQFINLNRNSIIPASLLISDWHVCVSPNTPVYPLPVQYLLSGSSMQLRLSANGVDKLMGQVGGMVVQLVALDAKFQNNQCYYACEVSDGFCKAKGCVLESTEGGEKEKLAEGAVVRVTKLTIQKSKKQKNIIIVEGYELLALPGGPIGSPILYDDYIKNGKVNYAGDNLVPPQRKMEKGKVEVKVEVKPQQVQKRSLSTDNEESRTEDENTRFNQKMPSKGQTKVTPQQNSTVSNNASRPQPPAVSKPPYPPKEEKKSTSLDAFVKPKGGPIERLPPKQQQQRGADSVGRQRKPHSQYNQIRSLHVGMENWAILGRIISLNPLKNYVTKKGTESTLLAFQIGDKSGTIECTVYGEPAQRYEGTLKEDHLYEISNGFIGESSYMGVHKLKLTVNDHTKVSLKEDDPSVPYMEDFCITIKKLTEVPVGEEVRVICLVKDQGEVESLASKDGKPLRKKLIVLCDPVDKVEAEMTLWNDDCGLQFECYPYMIKGIQVKEYQGNRQYSLRFNNRITILKQHPLRKYIKDMSSISFINPDSNKKPRRTAINTLHELNNALDEITPSGTWSEAVCFLTSMRFGKCFYIGCPKCKKKVVEEEDSKCVNCNHEYSHAQYRYVLSFNVADYTDSLWVNAYDEVGEALLGMPAGQFAKLDEDAFQSHMKKVRYRHKKLRMVTKDEEYLGNTRKKTTVIKVVDINYAEETKILLEKVKHLIGK